MCDFEREISIEKILEEQYKNELDPLLFLMIYFVKIVHNKLFLMAFESDKIFEEKNILKKPCIGVNSNTKFWKNL